MLGKLIKHEFRATARVMLPLFLAELALALMTNLTTLLIGSTASSLAQMFIGFVGFAFGLAVFAVSVMSLVVMIQRFYKNLLGDEGYLMFSLPAGVHSLVWSKLIVSSVWFIAVFVVHALSALLASGSLGVNFNWPDLVEVFPRIDAAFAANGAAFIIEGLVIVFLACVASCLLFYAAMATGYGFARHKGLLSVLFFFVFVLLSQILILGVFGAVFSSDIYVNMPQAVSHAQMMAAAHTVMLTLIGAEVLYCAVFYVITALNLKKRLNLE